MASVRPDEINVACPPGAWHCLWIAVQIQAVHAVEQSKPLDIQGGAVHDVGDVEKIQQIQSLRRVQPEGWELANGGGNALTAREIGKARVVLQEGGVVAIHERYEDVHVAVRREAFLTG